eukprot:COSAG01_NODE_2266_length_8042_cov_5.402493_3_plen_56_part_00
MYLDILSYIYHQFISVGPQLIVHYELVLCQRPGLSHHCPAARVEVVHSAVRIHII